MHNRNINKRNFKEELTAIIAEKGGLTGAPVKLNDGLRQRLMDIYSAESEGSLATVRADGWPQANVIDFWYVGLKMYFQTLENAQKAMNIERDSRVSLTITPPFNNFGEMLALSMAARAEKVTDRSEIGETYHLFLERVPHMKEFAQSEGDKSYPAPGMVVYCLRPEIISLIDFTKGYGHMDLVQIGQDDL